MVELPYNCYFSLFVMSMFYTVYGLFTLLFVLILSGIISYAPLSKFWKKHLKSRKKFYIVFALFSLAFFWVSLENALEENTLSLLFAIHAFLFLGYTLWSAKKIYTDYKRIQQAELRRKNR